MGHLCHLPGKGRKDLEELVEMKKRDRGERKTRLVTRQDSSPDIAHFENSKSVTLILT